MSKDVKNVPALRFKGYSDAWEKRKLGELIDHKSGKAIEKYFDNDGALKVISIGSYGLDNRYVDQGIRAISNTITQSRIINKNELAMVLNDKTANGSIIGRTLLIQRDREYVANQRTEIIHPKDMLDSGFTYFALNGIFRNSVKKIVQGGTQIYVNFSAIALLPLKIPTLSEQKKIQDFFKILTHLIAATQDSIEALGQAKKALLQHLFDQSWRFKGYSDPWEKRKLGEIARIFDGTHQTPNYQSSGIMFLSVENIQTLKSNKFISLEDFQKDFKVSPRTGDILMTRIGNIGTTNVVKSTRPIAYYVSLALIRPNDAIDVYYLNYAINGLSFQRELRRRTLSVAFPQKINKQEIGKSIVDLPSPSEQIQIGNLFVLLDNLIAATQSRLSSLESLKKSLLQDLFI